MAGTAPLITPDAAAAPQRGIVFFGHGSRDPLWSAPIEAVAQVLMQRHPQALACCAYLELTAPDLPSAAADLIARGCRHITVLPMFLGTGRHARNDLPQLVRQLQAQYPQVGWAIATAVGEDPRVTEVLAQIGHEYIA